MNKEQKTMNKRLKAKGLLLSLVLLFTSFTIIAVSPPAYAAFSDNSKKAACEGLSSTTGGVCDSTSGTSLNNVISTVLNIFSVIVGIIAVIMIIVAGLKFITSGGDAQKAASARNTILYAVIGLVIVVLSQVIVRFVLNKSANPCSAGQTLQADGTCR
ncbi:hypothetical protein A3D14_02915 [Candidatus Saccharibacteria bacterium RIFCSPHIGHO2_02_FULL_47_12]|nr:MAG: hypothetical protein A3D14_02915 [Candidatus Saccharibacteria bacterium RIFCSPHIGHO2_02_FULL_47_12]